MIELNEISKIGFGGYRISSESIENENALNYAISHGCNLVDTASNYTNGESEKLIGKILQNRKSEDAFVITKAGYISDENCKVLQKLSKNKNVLDETIHVSEELMHSIHPDYLDAQIEVSLKRLNRKYIDGFLLHSPEYYFEQKNQLNNTTEYYKRIKKAFEYLEEKVKEGIIRYYGISSNTLTVNENKYNSTDLIKLIELSKQVSSKNHFNLIQFPFNIIEQDAILSNKNDKKNLIEIAKNDNIKTFTNRPLNSNSKSGLLRLVIHDIEAFKLDISEDIEVYTNCINVIQKQLTKVDPESSISDISILVFLKENWNKISSPDAFDRVFYKLFYPFVNLIFNEKIPKNVHAILKQFETICWKYHLKEQSYSVITYLKSNNLMHLIDNEKVELLPQNLCKEYLKNGIDCVLVGMRKQHYVDSFKPLFH